MAIILAQNIQNPILIDKYLQGTVSEWMPFVTVKIFLFRVLWSISSCWCSFGRLNCGLSGMESQDRMTQIIIESSKNLAIELRTKGLVNIQYLIYKDELYVIEALFFKNNPLHQ